MPLRKKSNIGRRSRDAQRKRDKKREQPATGDSTSPQVLSAPVASTSTAAEYFPPPLPETIANFNDNSARPSTLPATCPDSASDIRLPNAPGPSRESRRDETTLKRDSSHLDIPPECPDHESSSHTPPITLGLPYHTPDTPPSATRGRRPRGRPRRRRGVNTRHHFSQTLSQTPDTIDNPLPSPEPPGFSPGAVETESRPDDDSPAPPSSLPVRGRPTLRRNVRVDGFVYDPDFDYASVTDIGNADRECPRCRAFKWPAEASYNFCCAKGKVRLPPLEEPPESLKQLFVDDSQVAQHFRRNILRYNRKFQMTSFGASAMFETREICTIAGAVYHRIGSLLPPLGRTSKYLQVYFLTEGEQHEARADPNDRVECDVVARLTYTLSENNSYVRDFRTVHDFIRSEPLQNYSIALRGDFSRSPENEIPGRPNAALTTNNVAVLMVGEPGFPREIIVRPRDGNLQAIPYDHPAYDPLQYPLLFPRGEQGYHGAIPRVDPNTRQELPASRVTPLEYYAYRLMIRPGEFNILHRGSSLSNQFWVDAFSRIESDRLGYYRSQQYGLRRDRLGHLRDALSRDTDPSNLGSEVVRLSASFVGGARNMHERSLDAHGYLREFGRPDMFVTLTCNLKWEAISRNLEYSRDPTDRPDIVVRVFHQKLNMLLDELVRKKIFGQTLAHLYSVEWQQNGLPHAHVLVWLRDKITPQQVDGVVCAEIPDPIRDPVLHNIVTSYMLHGPCDDANKLSSPCRARGPCSDRYPRPYRTETSVYADGYALYRRRSPDDGGNTYVKRLANGVERVYDNSWVVPYSPVLSRLFQAHVNVELLAGVRSVKYLFKYINKGSDLATATISNDTNDEITAYQNGHRISTYEAVWRLLSFKMYGNFPPVKRLGVHLERQQPVIFTSSNVAERVAQCKPSALMAFFALCSRDDLARTLLYTQVPAYFEYDKGRGEFVRRAPGRHASVPDAKKNVLGRLYTLNPSAGEVYYLRLLLTQVRGPTSFERLRTVDGILHGTYRDACLALGLLRDDTVWEDTLWECVAASQTPSQLRYLFATIIAFCNPSRPVNLWETFRLSLSEEEIDNWTAFDRALSSIEASVLSIRGRPLSVYGMPAPRSTQSDPYPLLHRETHYDAAEINAALSDEGRLLPGQREIFTRVTDSAESNSGKLFFLDAPGGCGKSFLVRVLLAKIRCNGGVALAVASSGIAATLLPGGRTAHSMFGLPLNPESMDVPTCVIPRDSDLALVLKRTKLIVWDECVMSDRKLVEAVDRAIRFVKDEPARPMGGITTVFAGDFRQILPIIRNGERAQEVHACLTSSHLWGDMEFLRLNENVRVSLAGGGRAFSDTLVRLGEGRGEYSDSIVRLTDELCRVVDSVQKLVDTVYPPDELGNATDEWLTERAILTPRNESADYINALLASRLQGDCRVYKSVNYTEKDAELADYPVEFLESLRFPGFPPHTITLKTGVPVVCLRNLIPPHLVNGTRCVVVSLQTHSIGVRVLTGPAAGSHYTIPRVPMQPADDFIKFTREQLPVAVCYAMTVNKSQGQSFKVAGIDLTYGCFAHGQLYVACSRVGDPSRLFVYAPGGCVQNVVYREVFQFETQLSR